MKPKLLKYLLDIESVISELESILERCEYNFHLFSKDIILKRAAERDLEIIGEAVNKIYQANSQIEITGYKKIMILLKMKSFGEF
ncbi:MAG: hypothetical protein COA33_013040 [Fluviicola sp.]|nr:hypothetical protein [Fluviicola sp.]